ncbi:formate dehydrogenase accessory sulfurtransferase FdhD [Aquibium sp. ELW1220]|uniref:formate dehydrogenase accessory sulfurtransferase FdhD n=1 Tax=Aquibium sp. ELW1220 TaxID=2976766 RepID=UPI0025AF25A9|nr:formate dehydrogenase accessory sulfurtransferase FdhD [Aquibium sp. ELW1220]MDN2580658.1 formate dehydrogenase accessory sulfurtransferase FdhD [Aquibium sp. ELW1220]
MSVAAFPSRRLVDRVARRDGARVEDRRAVPEETPVAFSYGGSTHAVMMATPDDLVDFAHGFSLTEGIIGSAGGIDSVDVVEAGPGIDLQISLAGEAGAALTARRRHLAGPVGCGLCGIESIEQALREPRPVADPGIRIVAATVSAAVAALEGEQPLNRATRAVHAAGFYDFDKGMVAVREDVGRHNALDKLAGALLRSGANPARGAVVVTSRISVEMVQKTAAIGCSFLFAVSAPTALAVRTAEKAGITLVAVVRGPEFEVFTHADRIAGGIADVA